MTSRCATPAGKKVEACVIESFGHIWDKFLAVLYQAVFLARKHHTHLSTEVRYMRDEWLTDISAALKNKAIACNYRLSISGNLDGDAPMHTLFPPAPAQTHPNLLLHMQASPLTSTRHNSVPSHAYSTFHNRRSLGL